MDSIKKDILKLIKQKSEELAAAKIESKSSNMPNSSSEGELFTPENPSQPNDHICTRHPPASNLRGKDI